MNIWYLTGGVILGVVAIAIILYLVTARRYESSASVANSYDQWTDEGILEFYWGEHIHLGHYGSPPERKNFLTAKADFVHEMVRWSILDTLIKAVVPLNICHSCYY